MTVFLLIAALLAALVLLLLMWPFLRKTAGADHESHRRLTTEIYRDQLADLERDRAMGTLGEDDFNQARTELQRRMLDDTRDVDVVTSLRAPRKTVIAVCLIVPLAAAGMYAWLGMPDAIVASNAHQRVLPADIERMVAGLAARLEKEPDNLKGWAMLARSYKALNRPVDAEKAYEHAGAFLDSDAQLLADYADTVATNANGNFAGKPDALIARALKVDPNNGMALWLAGTSALNAGNFDEAIRDWQALVKQLPPESDDARMLTGAIADARARGGKFAPDTAAGKTAAPAAAAATSSAGVSGRVDLDPALKSKVAAGDTILIFARVPGTRMPVAVLRAHAADLPIDFTLDDSLAMSPQARISLAAEVNVEARISKSGMAQPEPGDLISTVQTVKVGTRGIKLKVDQVRP